MRAHLTEEQICRAVAGQSTLDEHRHVSACPRCRSEITGTQQAIAALRHDIHLHAEHEVRRTTPSLVTRDAGGRLTTAFALAAASVLAVATALVWQTRATHTGTPAHGSPTRAELAAGHAGGAVASIDAVDAFYPLRYSAIPIVNGRIVRIEVPRSAPAAFGLDPIELANVRRGAVVADVLVGEDGLARAVRFVRPVRGNAPKE
jgi:hypothetical protein